jgi:hypothetical protein
MRRRTRILVGLALLSAVAQQDHDPLVWLLSFMLALGLYPFALGVLCAFALSPFALILASWLLWRRHRDGRFPGWARAAAAAGARGSPRATPTAASAAETRCAVNARRHAARPLSTRRAPGPSGGGPPALGGTRPGACGCGARQLTDEPPLEEHMATLTTHPAPSAAPALTAMPLEEPDQEFLERLEAMEVRLDPGPLAVVMVLHDAGHTAEQIASVTGLHPVVVGLETRRELQRRVEVPALTVEEWNSLAAGTHVPSRQLRQMIDTAIRFGEGLSRTSLLRDAGINDSTHGQRLLGFKPYPCEPPPRETVTCEYAVGVAYALHRAPVEVQGL